ncbi:MAG TPA: SpoIID/LytB domain-containing protein [Terracidiphilus sp.]|nr:SpoIID/LytB domain-containing protein [Terracidiphilus sp.]
MRRRASLATLLLAICLGGNAASTDTPSKTPSHSGFPQTVRVRLWYLHPPRELRISADAGQAQVQKCGTCKASPVTTLLVQASGSSVEVDRSAASQLRITGSYRITAADSPPVHADFPVELRADDGHLHITALMPMEEYIAGVLAGEAGNFKSEEALKAMAVAARTFAMHFGSRHALDGFDFCDTTHCQDLRLAGINPHLRQIAEATAGEVLWYDGEPAATYYYADCGGTTEDGHYILGNDEAPAPYLKQHSDRYCVRDGGAQWSSEISRRELQRALAEDGITIPGKLRSVAVVHRTPSGRVEFLRVTGSGSVTVSALLFRSAVGRHIGWERLKSNWYDVSARGDNIVFHGRGRGHGVGLCQIGAEVMGEEGRPYREILAFYYPGTRLGVSAQGIAWQQFANEDLELLTTRPERDRSLLPLATRYMHEAEENTGFVYRNKPRLKVYATVAEFRDASGEPGWVAASTRGKTIQMQPSNVLRDAGTLDDTVHHELLHMLIDAYTRPGTPQWFREGLVLYLTSPDSANAQRVAFGDVAALERSLHAPQSEEELRHAYAEARARVAQLAQQYGKETLLQWVQNGLPAEATGTIQRAGAH